MHITNCSQSKNTFEIHRHIRLSIMITALLLLSSLQFASKIKKKGSITSYFEFITFYWGVYDSFSGIKLFRIYDELTDYRQDLIISAEKLAWDVALIVSLL